MKNTCLSPFFTAEIFGNGDVYICCPDYTLIGTIGNVFKQSWEEVWYSKKAVDLRNKILAGDYSSCRLSLCEPEFFPLCIELENIDKEKLDFNNPKARIVKISTERSCNVACTLCRSRVICNEDEEQIAFLDSKIESVFMPILKDAEIVNFCGSGDPFVSKHFRKIIKIAALTYPNLRFDLHTNGLLCNEENLTELGIIDRLSTVQISLHSATKEVYDRIVKRGNWEKLNSNLGYLAGLIEKGKLNQLHLNFVVNADNYVDIPLFIELCKKYHAKAFFWQYRDLGGVYSYDKMNICSPAHAEHKEFVRIMSNLKYDKNQKVFMTPLLRKFTQIKDVEQYYLTTSILMDNVIERYESKFSRQELRFQRIEQKLRDLEKNNGVHKVQDLQKIQEIIRSKL